jgi:hypothetical protein
LRCRFLLHEGAPYAPSAEVQGQRQANRTSAHNQNLCLHIFVPDPRGSTASNRPLKDQC